ncbi:MAG: HAD hydrolase-like protein [Anaerolineales bacterium]|nr:HAD hydrolase-like protein [Anaerolineales bacterium]
MINTLLVDLDDTLLKNDMDTFIPAYIKLLGKKLSPWVPEERLVPLLYQGTYAMFENKNSESTLEEVFDENFYPPLGLSKAELQGAIDDFYLTDFPELKAMTDPIPSAQQLIAYAFDNQLEVVIATNPLFPGTAIEQRLDWAGLGVNEFTYALVTSYENAHFAKPNMEYFAEILGLLGRNPYEAAMIGNDHAHDILPAKTLGLDVFHLTNQSNHDLPAGDQDQAVEWLRSIINHTGSGRFTTPENLIARLRGNLAAFVGFEDHIEEDLWSSRPKEDTWAPVEIIAHLRDVELEVNLPRVKAILHGDEPFLSAPDSDKWATERWYISQPIREAMKSLIRARKQTIDILGGPDLEIWQRTARHAIFGPTDLLEIVRIFIEHDIMHLRQLRETLASLSTSFK